MNCDGGLTRARGVLDDSLEYDGGGESPPSCILRTREAAEEEERAARCDNRWAHAAWSGALL